MTRLPERLPAGLSERLASASQAIYSRLGREVDVAIGGIPFMLATSSEVQQSIETIPIRKDQFDSERDPGEQSLSSWWRRSQASFHQGAGFRYEPTTDDQHDGFWDSEGVDVFTQGNLTLLKKMVALTDGTVLLSRVRSYATSSTAPALSAVGDGAFYKSTTDGNPTSTLVSLHAPAGKTIVDGLISGTSFYDVASDGTLYQGNVSSPGTATSWPCGTTPSRLAWGKHRLWVIGGRKLWQPNLSLAGGASQDPIFTHPNQGWTYNCMTEGPAAMYFGGHDGFTSSIQAVTFDSGGGIPSLSGATVTAVLPDGELVQELAVLAGQYVGIGTSRGFRVGVVQQDSSITYGPLLVEPEGVSACTAITTQGKFFIVGFETDAGTALVYRVDTSTDLGSGVFPYAKDASCEFVGHWTSAAAIGDRLYGTTDDGRAWYQSSTEYVESGWLQTSRIRYRTTEPKAFKYLDLDIEPLTGALSFDAVLEGGSILALGSLTTEGEVVSDTYSWSYDSPMRYASLRLNLVRSDAGTETPTVHSYLIRALPAVKPQHLITLPLLCFDSEQARSGQRYGTDGYSADRLTALMLLERGAQSLIFQDFTTGIGVGLQVVIESMKFIQTTPRDSGSGNSGGILILQLRTVDA